ncbi:hypothetical protein [Niallia oryzisoli]|uniref:hypothetical protein n=1 Tax=Niallia oryzisoli TaxID=1737571 RepID=UPI0037367777
MELENNFSVNFDNQMFNQLDSDGSQFEQNVNVNQPKYREADCFLDQYGRNLTNEVREGRVIGRDKEIGRVHYS